MAIKSLKRRQKTKKPYVTPGEFYAQALNKNRGTEANRRELRVLELLRQLKAGTRFNPKERREKYELLGHVYYGKSPQWPDAYTPRAIAAWEELKAILKEATFRPELRWPLDRGFVIDMVPAPRSKCPNLWFLLQLTHTDAWERLEQCLCGRWYFRRRRHKQCCSDACRDKKYRSDPAVKARLARKSLISYWTDRKGLTRKQAIKTIEERKKKREQKRSA
jgi:hypothetical protein